MGTLGQMRMLVADCERLVRRVEALIEQDRQEDLYLLGMATLKVQADIRKMRKA